MPPTIHYLPSVSWWLVAVSLQVSGSNTKKHISKHIVRWNWVCLASWEWTWKHRAKLAGSVWYNAIGDTIESMLGSIFESILRDYIRAYMAVSVRSSVIRSFLESMLHRVLENVLRSVPGNILHQHNVIRSGSHTQSSQTLRATSPALLSTSRRSQTPLELSQVLSDSARAISGCSI